MMLKRFAALLLVFAFCFSALSCSKQSSDKGLGNGEEPIRSMELSFAKNFTVDYYASGCKLISIEGGDRFLTVPEGIKAPKGIAKDITILQQPIENIYLAATAAMCLFDGLDRLDSIRLSGTKADGWYIENARTAMENGSILYAGKYSQPDYELILSENCPLAIESGMISHASDVQTQLEKLGIAVLIDRSSYESHPLARTEWIKLYGALLDEEEKAEERFKEQVELMNAAAEPSGKSVAFFRISPNGYAVARRSGDYVSRMIELAGGEYAFSSLGNGDSALSTVNVEMETFFQTARDADVIIYNSTIGGEIESLDEFLNLNPVLAELKATRNGEVWCTRESMYQQTLNIGRMIAEIGSILSASPKEKLDLIYFFRLEP